jgi:hypothetical protein
MTSFTRLSPIRLLASLAVLAALAAHVCAAEPTLRSIDVRGLQIGGTTTVVVDGDGLGGAPRLVLPFAAKQALKPGATATRAVFDVTLDGNVEPGYANLWLATAEGISLPVVIALDRLPQRTLTPMVDRLPAALHGSVAGSIVVSTRFAGKAGEKVLVEVEAQRLGSKLRPVVHLYDAKSRQIGWAWPRPALSGDARLEATLPADGTFTVSLHDAEYGGATPGFFRLKIGQWSFVDQVFPPVVGKDQRAVELLGPSSQHVELPSARKGRCLPLPWPRAALWSGPRPFVTLSPHAEVLAAPAGKVQDLPAGPIGVSGRLLRPRDEERFRLPVVPGSKVRLEVFAERIGSPLAAALIVRNEAGGELARADEGPDSLDPVLEYTVPLKVTSLVVGVADVQGRGGPLGVYRLRVTPVGAGEAVRDFRLLTPTQRLALPATGRCVLPVLIERRGYSGSVTVSAEGLPAGTKLDGTTIPPGADGALVTLQRDGAGEQSVITTWQGRAEDGQERPVVLKGHPLERLQPWLAPQMALALTTAKGEDFTIDWRGLAADVGIVPARKLSLPVKVVRPPAPSLVRLTLLTSQLPPLLNGQPNVQQTLRPERPVELAAKVNDGEVPVLVPPDLPAPSYDVTVQAELLSPDRRTVLATAFAPVRRLAVRVPLLVHLQGPPRIEVKSSPKAPSPVVIKGKIERKEGLAGDVALTLTGLPPGLGVPQVTVKAAASDFELKLNLPTNYPAGEVKGLKLSASAVADPKQPGVRVRSRDVELSLVVALAAK